MYFLLQTAVHKRDIYKLYNQTDKAIQISLRLWHTAIFVSAIKKDSLHYKYLAGDI